MLEQDLQPPMGSSLQHIDQVMKLVANDINRINMSLNEVNFHMLWADDHVFHLQTTIHKHLKQSETLQQLL